MDARFVVTHSVDTTACRPSGSRQTACSCCRNLQKIRRSRAFQVSRGNHDRYHLFLQLAAADSAFAALDGVAILCLAAVRSCEEWLKFKTLATLRSSSQRLKQSIATPFKAANLATLRSSSQGVDSSKAHSRKLRERSANSRGTQYPSTAHNDFHIQ